MTICSGGTVATSGCVGLVGNGSRVAIAMLDRDNLVIAAKGFIMPHMITRSWGDVRF
ncbi:hypothetical protein [Rhodopirellula sp. SWK7]|uniref:hypothetical protein n=1 Tax=Rhodopirellula sp. SWK7 TaxID=595460 RepID=UPI001360B401|nr:hypothetical protein [Rhodopirellula sp. SWK7]